MDDQAMEGEGSCESDAPWFRNDLLISTSPHLATVFTTTTTTTTTARTNETKLMTKSSTFFTSTPQDADDCADCVMNAEATVTTYAILPTDRGATPTIQRGHRPFNRREREQKKEDRCPYDDPTNEMSTGSPAASETNAREAADLQAADTNRKRKVSFDGNASVTLSSCDDGDDDDDDTIHPPRRRRKHSHACSSQDHHRPLFPNKEVQEANGAVSPPTSSNTILHATTSIPTTRGTPSTTATWSKTTTRSKTTTTRPTLTPPTTQSGTPTPTTPTTPSSIGKSTQPGLSTPPGLSPARGGWAAITPHAAQQTRVARSRPSKMLTTTTTTKQQRSRQQPGQQPGQPTCDQDYGTGACAFVLGVPELVHTIFLFLDVEMDMPVVRFVCALWRDVALSIRAPSARRAAARARTGARDFVGFESPPWRRDPSLADEPPPTGEARGVDFTAFHARRGNARLVCWARSRGCAWNASTYTAAAGGGQLETLKTLHERGCPRDIQRSICAAAREGHLDVLDWHERSDHMSYVLMRPLVDVAAERGHLHVLDWLHRRGHWPKSSTATSAVRGGHVRVLEWLLAKGYHRVVDPSLPTCDVAAHHGRMAALRWLVMHGGVMTASTCSSAARGGHARALLWALHHGCPFNEWSYEMALRHGHLGVLCHLHAAGCPPCENACQLAAKCGRADMVWRARALGHPWDGNVCVQAARSDRPLLVQHLCKRGCPFDVRTVHALAFRGRLDVIKHLRNGQGATWNQHTFALAALGGHLHLIRWLRGHGCPWSDTSISGAIKGCHLPAVRWLRRHGCPWSENVSEVAFNSCILFNIASSTPSGAFYTPPLTGRTVACATQARSANAACGSRRLAILRWIMHHGCPFDPTIRSMSMRLFRKAAV